MDPAIYSIMGKDKREKDHESKGRENRERRGSVNSDDEKGTSLVSAAFPR